MEQSEIKKNTHLKEKKAWKELVFSKALVQLLICGQPQWKVSKMAATFDMRIRK